MKEPIIQGVLLHFQRRDGVHWIRNESRATGLTVKEQPTRRVTGWLTNSRCIADEVENFQCEHHTQPKHHCQDELALAIVEGLREKLQVDGNIEVCSIGPRFNGHDDEPTDEDENENFYDHVTEKLFLGHSVRAARQEEIKSS